MKNFYTQTLRAKTLSMLALLFGGSTTAFATEAPTGGFKKVICFDIEQFPELDGRVNIAINASRLSFHISKSDKNYAQFKAILIDVCNPKKPKPIDLSFDEREQTIVSLNYHK